MNNIIDLSTLDVGDLQAMRNQDLPESVYDAVNREVKRRILLDRFEEVMSTITPFESRYDGSFTVNRTPTSERMVMTIINAWEDAHGRDLPFDLCGDAAAPPTTPACDKRAQR